MKPRMISSRMLSQKRLFQHKQQLPQAYRPSIVWNAMEDMEESVVPEALFSFHPTIPCSAPKATTLTWTAELWNVGMLS